MKEFITSQHQPRNGRFEVIWKRLTERGRLIESSPMCTLSEATALQKTLVEQFVKDCMSIEVSIVCHDVKTDHEPLEIRQCTM